MHTPPHLALSPLMSRYPQVAQQFSCNDASLRFHIMNLISQLVPNGHPDNLAMVVTYICGTLTRMHRSDQLGPRGIQSTEDVFIGIGYDKVECYMGLIVNAPGARAVVSVFEGDRMEIRTMVAMKPEAAIDKLRNRFSAKLIRKYEELRDVQLKQKRW